MGLHVTTDGSETLFVVPGDLCTKYPGSVVPLVREPSKSFRLKPISCCVLGR